MKDSTAGQDKAVKIITHHISPYHSVQGTAEEVAKVIGKAR